MDYKNLLVKLNECRTGCLNGLTVINYLMYADDLVIFSPYSHGLACLLKVCENYGLDNDVIYNLSKSALLVICSPLDKQSKFPSFSHSSKVLIECEEVKYLAHIINNTLRNNKAILRQRCVL